jgi:hypothetical protein
MPRPDRAVDHGLRLADNGACVPWDALAAIERAQADAADRRRMAEGRSGVAATGSSRLGRLRRALTAGLTPWTDRSR